MIRDLRIECENCGCRFSSLVPLSMENKVKREGGGLEKREKEGRRRAEKRNKTQTFRKSQLKNVFKIFH